MAICLWLLPNVAEAGTCPDFYRFVDFGLQDDQGRFSRGGPLFRGESLTGTTLLRFEETQCRPVRDVARDGHGNPMPVVTHMAYDVQRAGLDLLDLHVSYSDNTRHAADKNGAQHRQRLAQSETFQGSNSLCARSNGMLSCQVISPYPGNIDLVIYCDSSVCRMPDLAATETTLISASWTVGADFWEEPSRSGEVIYEKVQTIHGFLDPLTSGL